MSHAFYVTAAYAVSALLMLADPLLATLRHRRALREAAAAAAAKDD